MKSINKVSILFGIVVLVAAAAWWWTKQPPQGVVDRGAQGDAVVQVFALESKTDSQGSVTVEVTPVDFSATDPVWIFEVSLNTHSVELNDDMAANSFLIDAAGNVHAAIAWEGDPPGGHHRKGMLRFVAFAPLPRTLTLQMQNVAGVPERLFSWDLGVATEQEVFTVPEQEYDFGVIKQSGGIVTHEFSFAYNGIQELKVLGVPTSCSCTSAVIDKEILRTGDNATVTVSFDPNLHEEPAGRFYKTITLLTEPKVEAAPEWKIWVEIDLDLGPEAYKLKSHQD